MNFSFLHRTSFRAFAALAALAWAAAEKADVLSWLMTLTR